MAKLVIGRNLQRVTPAIVRDKSPESYRVFEKNTDGKLVSSTSTPWIPLPAGTIDIDSYLFYSAYADTPSNVLSGEMDLSSLSMISGSYAFDKTFQRCTGITSVDLSSLETTGQYSCEYMFRYCTGITSVDLGAFISPRGDYSCRGMFQECTGITGSLDLSSIITTSGRNDMESMFNSCTGITSVDLSGVIALIGNYVCQYMFSGCTSLTSVDLSHLCKLGTNNQLQQTFENTALTSLSFPNLAYTATNYNSAFNKTLKGVTGCTVHFPADWQTTMSSWANITNGLGGTNTTVLFDLPAVTTLDLSHITSIEKVNILSGFFANDYFPNVTSVNLSGLTTVKLQSGLQNAFVNNPAIASVNLSSLTTLDANYVCQDMFKNCTGLTSIDLSSLTTVRGQSPLQSMFQGCTSLVSVDLSSLTSCTGFGYMFSGCSSLTNVNLSSLSSIPSISAFGNTFKDCTSLTSLSFPALTSTSFGIVANQFDQMLSGVTGCTVHFPSNLQSVIGSWTSVQNGFSGTNTTVLFDLPATE